MKKWHQVYNGRMGTKRKEKKKASNNSKSQQKSAVANGKRRLASSTRVVEMFSFVRRIQLSVLSKLPQFRDKRRTVRTR